MKAMPMGMSGLNMTRARQSRIKEIAVQVNGKLRATFNISTSAADEEYINGALALPKIEKYLDGHKLVKTIVVKNRLVNLIIK